MARFECNLHLSCLFQNRSLILCCLRFCMMVTTSSTPSSVTSLLWVSVYFPHHHMSLSLLHTLNDSDDEGYFLQPMLVFSTHNLCWHFLGIIRAMAMECRPLVRQTGWIFFFLKKAVLEASRSRVSKLWPTDQIWSFFFIFVNKVVLQRRHAHLFVTAFIL